MPRTVEPPGRHRLSIWVMALVFLVTGCTSLPQAGYTPASFAYTNTQSSGLHQRIEPLVDDAPSGQSGFYLLDSGLDALAARMALIESAEVSLDIQSFEFRDQASTWLVMQALLEAADRGVRVRLLVDDWGMAMPDAQLTALAEHPRLEVRLFNPFAARTFRVVDYVGHFEQIHRRMHNKLFIADNQVTILGGRNKGDAYFGGTQGWHYMDLDMLAIGPLVRETSSSFDLYWNHELALPVDEVSRTRATGQLADTRVELSGNLSAYPLAFERLHLGNGNLVDELAAGEVPFIWADYTLMMDHPDKLLTPPDESDTHLITQLYEHMDPVQSDVLMVSPYLIPPETGLVQIAAWRDRGVDVRLLTNSLAANDQPIVHSGYRNYREPLLTQGVSIWEIQPQPDAERLQQQWHWVEDSRLTLHAKLMVFDRHRLFIGSPNLDPRSYNLNTEVAVLIDSEELAGQAIDWFEINKSDLAWELALDDNGPLAWVTHANDEPEIKQGREPGANVLRRMSTRFWSIMPIEWML